MAPLLGWPHPNSRPSCTVIIQEEEEKENAMGLATTDWLQSPAPSTPAGSPRPHPTPTPGPFTDNPALVAAAVNRENVFADDHAAGKIASDFLPITNELTLSVCA